MSFEGMLAVVGALIVGWAAVITGLFLFRHLNKSLNLVESLRSGNVAVAIIAGAALFATALLVQGGLNGVVLAIAAGKSAVGGLLQLVVGFALSLVVVNGGSRLFDLLTPKLAIFTEIVENDNRAVATAWGFFIVSLAWVISTSLNALAF